jgi:hypothetical protein
VQQLEDFPFAFDEVEKCLAAAKEDEVRNDRSELLLHL